MHANYIRPGGVSQDLPLGTLKSIYEFIKSFSDRINELEDLLTENRIWKIRLQGIGSINLQKAFLWGFSGVMLRGSGARWDLRKVNPYEIYSELNLWQVPVGNQGDCYDRYLVRIDEMRQSLIIIENCLNEIPSGEVKSFTLKLNPSKNSMKLDMESTIQHFKSMSVGLVVPTGDSYTSI